MTLEFSIELAQSLVESTEQFPVDFDALWQWCDYSRKDNALVVLKKNFDPDSDCRQAIPQNSGVGNAVPRKYYLTVSAAKEFAMIAGTDKGKRVRGYFLECERKLKEILTVPKTQTELMLMFAQQLVDQERKQKEIDAAQQAQQIEIDRLKLEQQQMLARENQAIAVLNSVPTTDLKAIPKSVRSQLNEYVRAWASANKQSYGVVWNKLYKELAYRYHIDLKTRASNQNRSCMDIASELTIGDVSAIELLFAIACEVLV